jgi:hypothetical protein
VPLSNVASVAVDCPRLDGKTVTSTGGSRYLVECGVDSRGAGREVPGDEIGDIAVLAAYSFDDCLGACSGFNRYYDVAVQTRPLPVVCRGVVFRRRLDEKWFATNGGNCYLKNATRAEGNGGKADPDAMAGVLQ